MTRLESVNLSRNLIYRWNSIENLKKLRYLNLAQNQLSSIEFIDELISLEELDISQNQLEIIDVKEVHLKLKSINISENPLFDLSGVEKFSNLNKLQAENLDLSEIELDVLMDLKQLKYICITLDDINLQDYIKD